MFAKGALGIVTCGTVIKCCVVPGRGHQKEYPLENPNLTSEG